LKGRTPVLEVLEIDNEVQKLIIDKKGEKEITELARSKGMISMKEDAMIKCMDGLIPFSEIHSL